MSPISNTIETTRQLSMPQDSRRNHRNVIRTTVILSKPPDQRLFILSESSCHHVASLTTVGNCLLCLFTKIHLLHLPLCERRIEERKQRIRKGSEKIIHVQYQFVNQF
ncbi:unnamed protein product [Lactuca virosa]|uniref:Uncharacterized protein n=1 Tax=Lactuca virosa TaxID=75947 RepID=A0AAU9M927_9ASTR|nr:unnamed protein product [Lactuca virosa]